MAECGLYAGYTGACRHGVTAFGKAHWHLTQWGADGSGGLELYQVTEDREGYYNREDDPEHAVMRDRLHGLLKQGYPIISRGAR